MAKTSVSGGVPAEPIHHRTSAGTEKSQVAVLGIDGSDLVPPASATEGLRVELNRTPVALFSGSATWASSIGSGIEVTVDLDNMPANMRVGRLLLVLVRNPSTITALTGQIQVEWNDGSLRFADVSGPGGPSTFTVNANNGGGQAFFVDGGLLAAGGRLSMRNNTALGGGQGFAASVQVYALAGS
jgi:hypothetical protein